MIRASINLTLFAALASFSFAQDTKPMPRPQDGVAPPNVVVPQPPPPSPVPPGGVAPPPALLLQETLPFPIPTHRQFAESLRPLPGKYRVVMLHPCTCRPVEVCFELPDRCVKSVKASRDSFEVRYGLCSYVKICFGKGGDVKVRAGCCTYCL